jgi:hypothetical protein
VYLLQNAVVGTVVLHVATVDDLLEIKNLGVDDVVGHFVGCGVDWVCCWLLV